MKKKTSCSSIQPFSSLTLAKALTEKGFAEMGALCGRALYKCEPKSIYRK